MADAVRFRVVGMDCAHDAAEIEAATRVLPSVEEVRVSVASQVLTLSPRAERDRYDDVETAKPMKF